MGTVKLTATLESKAINEMLRVTEHQMWKPEDFSDKHPCVSGRQRTQP